jgi:hypothetical protein
MTELTATVVGTLDQIAAIEDRVRRRFTHSPEFPEPSLTLNLKSRSGITLREFKYLNWMCMGHVQGFREKNLITLGYATKGYIEACRSQNPLSIFSAARALLEAHAWIYYVIKNLDKTTNGRPEDWKDRGIEFFQTIVRAKYATTDPEQREALHGQGLVEDLKPIQVMTCLDHLSKVREYSWARSHYEWLCEFVHPNALRQSVGVQALTIMRAGSTRIFADKYVISTPTDGTVLTYSYPSAQRTEEAVTKTAERALASALASEQLIQNCPESPFSLDEVGRMTGTPEGGPLLSLNDVLRRVNGRLVVPGRNETCPCGSGLKFKKCHGTQSTHGLK